MTFIRPNVVQDDIMLAGLKRKHLARRIDHPKEHEGHERHCGMCEGCLTLQGELLYCSACGREYPVVTSAES